MPSKAINLMQCSCQSEYQDRKYGKGTRVFCPSKPDSFGKIEKHCTVCSGKPHERKMKKIATGWTPPFSLPPTSAGPVYK